MDELKQCKRCELCLPVDMFYRHSRMADGRLNFCQACVKQRISDHREANLERIQQYDRERGKRPERKAQLLELTRRYFADPVKARASRAVTNALRSGRLLRPSQCSQCQKTCKPEAHHDDYTQPLEVRWLCRSCHCRHHRLAVLAADAKPQAA